MCRWRFPALVHSLVGIKLQVKMKNSKSRIFNLLPVFHCSVSFKFQYFRLIQDFEQFSYETYGIICFPTEFQVSDFQMQSKIYITSAEYNIYLRNIQDRMSFTDGSTTLLQNAWNPNLFDGKVRFHVACAYSSLIENAYLIMFSRLDWISEL
jgi:hypothetical protein